MSKACMHVARDTRDKPTYRSRRIHRKQVCHCCGWEREYAMPVDSGYAWVFSDWRPPERRKKHGNDQ